MKKIRILQLLALTAALTLSFPAAACTVGGNGSKDEDGGMIKAYGNTFDCAKVVLITQNDTADKTKIDCYLASSRDEKVPAEYSTAKSGNVYNNFDTAANFYSYNPDSPEVARDKVKKFAGRMGGGDVEFVFDNAVEDANSSVIPELKKLLVGYTSCLIKTGED